MCVEEVCGVVAAGGAEEGGVRRVGDRPDEDEAVDLHGGALAAGLGLQRTRRDLQDIATSAVLFDTEGFTRDMERSFEMMWDLYAAGEAARHLVVGRTRERSATRLHTRQ